VVASPAVRQLLLSGRTAQFTPLSLPSLTGWSDFADPLTLFQDSARITPAASNGDPEGGITDKSGTGNHLSQDTANQRGSLLANVQNGRSVCRLDGVNDYFVVGGPVFAGTGDFTLTLVIRPKDFSAERAIWDTLPLGGSGSRPNNVLFVIAAGGKLRMFTNAAFTTSSTNALTAGAFNYISFVRSAGTVTYWINGTADPTTVSVPTNITGATGVAGRYADVAGAFFADDYAEVVACRTALNAGQMASLNSYIRSKWGLS
jgi:hypothetical protein